jgi:DNA-binding XRE family transcriptional regulator
MENTVEQEKVDDSVNVNEVREAKAKLLKAFNVHLRKAGLTQAELARTARVSPQTIHQVVKGESRNRMAVNTIRSYLPAFWHDYMMPHRTGPTPAEE